MDLNELQNNPEQIKSLINLLQNLLEANNTPHNDTKTKEEEYSTLPAKEKLNRKNIVQENKFLSMPEKDMHKDDTQVDKVLCKHPPVARSREFTRIKVKCRVCGKEEEVNPGLVYDLRDNRYKCNRCSTSSG
jgi:uncharacterized metal-binding protein YceD (DUF177 family)